MKFIKNFMNTYYIKYYSFVKLFIKYILIAHWFKLLYINMFFLKTWLKLEKFYFYNKDNKMTII